MISILFFFTLKRVFIIIFRKIIIIICFLYYDVISRSLDRDIFYFFLVITVSYLDLLIEIFYSFFYFSCYSFFYFSCYYCIISRSLDRDILFFFIFLVILFYFSCYYCIISRSLDRDIFYFYFYFSVFSGFFLFMPYLHLGQPQLYTFFLKKTV